MILLRAKLPLLVAALMVFAAAPALAQTGTVSGTVRNAETGEPLASAQVSLEGTAHGTLTQSNGRFLLLNVPAGSYTLRVDLIGYAESSQQVAVTAGETTTLEVRVQPEAVSLAEIVVTGVAGATQRVKLPFEVAQVSSEDLPVPAVSAATALQGKVAGVTVVQGSGRPGASPSILLRGPTSINASGRDQEPLYIVDGVILGSDLVDLDALDIQSIEVVKGAAASSLYGSRAANGVIQIRTKRGQQLEDNVVRYTIRSEYGQSELGSTPDALLAKRHQYALTPDGLFINTDGSTCEWLLCSSPRLAGQAAAPGQAATAWNTFKAEAWPGQTFDQVQRFFTDGAFLQNYFSVEGRNGATNYHVSLSNLQNEGVMRSVDGFDRTNLRVNVDQAVRENVQVQASAFYSRSEEDHEGGGAGGSLMFDLTRMPAGVDLLAEDPFEPGEIVLVADPTNRESPNPIYTLLNRETSEDHNRFLGSVNLRVTPISWLDLDANASYDRLDRDDRTFYPKGYRTPDPSSINEGYLSRFRRANEALNASLTSTFRFDLTDNIRNRTQLRYLYESQDREDLFTEGFEFAVSDVPVFENLNPDRISTGQFLRTIRADGYFAITNFDILDRYIVDALVRNDGSSLFGEDERRQWYYRAAGAWRLGEEPWFAVPGIDEFKLRYSFGTAGGRPRFEAQYETYSVSGGRVSPVTLGNTNLKPEFSIEQEAGIDAGFLGNRFILGLTYANAVTEDQILPVPLPAYSGFGTQWRNAGTLESNTWEATLEANLVQTPDLSWSARLLYDRTRSTITELTVPPFQFGVAGQALGNVFYAREGEEYGTFYGVHYARSCADLPEGMSCDGFAVDNEGYLVWVGSGGLGANAWGTSSDVSVRGASVFWGTPFSGECTDRSTGERTLFCPVGNSMPDYNVSLSSTLGWKGLSVYGLVDASQGFDVYNQPLQWGTFRRNTGIMDQTGVSETQRKPLGYYDALYGVSGLQPSNVFVEDGSFVKLREVSVGYRLSPDLLALPGLDRFSGIGLSLVGRNLLTWTDYRGYDPEIGSGGGETGSAALARVDGYQYPNFRTWTAAIELIF
ncbi:MAG: SusC/RagA family TonB-linked outer membrane protein [Longimicrobiales bacterium]